MYETATTLLTAVPSKKQIPKVTVMGQREIEREDDNDGEEIEKSICKREPGCLLGQRKYSAMHIINSELSDS